MPSVIDPDSKQDKDLSPDQLEDAFNNSLGQNEVESGIQELEDLTNQGNTQDDENFTGIPSSSHTNPSNATSSTDTGWGGDSSGSQTDSGTPSASQLEQSATNQKIGDKDKGIQTEGGLVPERQTTDKAAAKVKGKGFLTRKRSGVIAALLIGGTLGIGSIVQGPLQFLHFASLLEQFHLPFSEDQELSSMTRVYRFLRDPSNPENRRLSNLAKSHVERLEALGRANGIEFDHRRGARNRLGAMSIRTDNPVAVQEFRKRFGTLPAPVDGIIRIEINNTRQSRLAIDAFTSTIRAGPDKVGAGGVRRLKRKAGASLRWLGELGRNFEDRTSFFEKWRQNRQQKITDGARNNTTIRIADPEGETPPPRPDPNVDAPDTETGRLNVVGAGGLSIIGGLCLAQGVANQVDSLHHQLVWLPAMRIAAKQLSLGSHVKAMDVDNLDELGFEAELFDTKEAVYKEVPKENGSGETTTVEYTSINWTASSKLKEKFGETGGIEPEPDMIPKNDASDNPVTNFIQSVPLLGEVCNVANNVIIGPILDRLTGAGIISVILEATAGDAILSRAIDIATRAFVGVPMAIDAVVGPGLWWAADVGTLLLMNDNATSDGALTMSEAQEQTLNARAYQQQRREYAQKPFFARIFDYKDPRSLVAQFFIRNDYSESPLKYGGRALASLSPDKIVAPFTQPAYAATPGITSVQKQYYGQNRIGWTDEETKHSLADFDDQGNQVNNGLGEYVKYIFRDNDFGYYQQYSNEFTELCYGMNINSDESVVPVEDGSKHPNYKVRGEGLFARDVQPRTNFCEGTATLVEARIRKVISSLNEELQQIAKDNGWTSEQIREGRRNNQSICSINSRTREICARISVLEGIIGEMNPGACRGVFYLPYTHALHNARIDTEDFPQEGDCAKFPGERLHQNARIYLRDMGTMQKSSCINGLDDKACEDIGFQKAQTSNQQQTGGGSFLDGLSNIIPSALAQQILDSGNVTGNSRYMDQIRSYAAGDTSCNINPTILALLTFISQRHSIYITSLNRQCTGVLTEESGEGSYHYRSGGGHAVDIGIVDGVTSTGATANDIELLNEVIPKLPADSGIGQSNCRSTPLSLPEGIRQFSDSCNHIHIEVPVQ